MSDSLSDLSLEELWQLFPIQLVAPQPEWQSWYADEERCLKRLLPINVAINHIGSTAIDNIWAKPIVDILVEAPQASRLAIRKILEQNDYICMAQQTNRIDFNKGYLPQRFAERVFYLHLRVPGDNDEIYFRDYLNNHPEIAHQYEELKLTLWKPYEHDRDGYTDAKTEFVKKYTQLARRGKV
ncbi:GrpB family protein [Pediococcus acidilactici]